MWAIVVAAGEGTRFGGYKQFSELAGREVVDWSIGAAARACGSGNVILVVPGSVLGANEGRASLVVAGGGTRAASVRAGLALVPEDAEVVVVHDAARPLASEAVWQAVIEAVRRGADGAVPCVPVADTIKQCRVDGSLVTLPRPQLVAAQTPQAFKATALREAHAGGGEATDDAALVEAAGGRVVSVPGDPCNLKVTTPLDLALARAAALAGAVQEHKAGAGAGGLP
ncbi:MAG TPA: 2-C-methyl-D-erythritol 4-phosphate cytidylyltransferase [Acidimicrobiales bacterium]|nr:2-C-methyl-D-erythritol 4-phosphate cytidylyltransferase [Acidimicrobiales bacterium]